MTSLDELRRASSLFTGVEDWYDRYRPGVPTTVVDWLTEWIGPIGDDRELLDLGTGTGQVIEAFGKTFATYAGVDPSAGMLERATARIAAAGLADRVRWLEAAAEEAAARPWPAVQLVTVCRAFHWMDQQTLLTALAGSTAPDAGIAVFGDSSFWESDEPWAHEAKRTVQDFLGEKRRARKGNFTHHSIPYSDMMKESDFSAVEVVALPVERSWTPTSALGYLYSTTFAAPELFGDRRQAFEDLLMDRLDAHTTDGVLTERTQFTIQAGRRP